LPLNPVAKTDLLLADLTTDKASTDITSFINSDLDSPLQTSYHPLSLWTETSQNSTVHSCSSHAQGKILWEEQMRHFKHSHFIWKNLGDHGSTLVCIWSKRPTVAIQCHICWSALSLETWETEQFLTVLKESRRSLFNTCLHLKWESDSSHQTPCLICIRKHRKQSCFNILSSSPSVATQSAAATHSADASWRFAWRQVTFRMMQDWHEDPRRFSFSQKDASPLRRCSLEISRIEQSHGFLNGSSVHVSGFLSKRVTVFPKPF
jgi:hypothetical protein